MCTELQANREREKKKKIENATRSKDSNPLGVLSRVLPAASANEDREMAKGKKHGEH